MKSIILTLALLMGFLNTSNKMQEFDFDKAWKEVEKDIKNRLPKSALDKTEVIYKMASQLNNQPQQAKSLVFIGRLTIDTNEKGIEKVIERYQKSIETSQEPVRSIMTSYLAELYQTYFNSNRWEISQRTELEENKSSDFRTWSSGQFTNTIEKLYLNAISNKAALNVPIDEFKVALTNYNKAGKELKPTLYAILADRALSYFSENGETSATNPESFQIDQPAFFSERDTFVSMKISDHDRSSVKYKVIRLYQEVLSLQDITLNQSALADFDLKRLQYVFGESTLENKKEIYIRELKSMAKNYKDVEFQSDILYVLAQQIKSDSQPESGKAAAIRICEEAIRNYPGSHGAVLCQNMINEIKKPYIQIYGEQVYPANQSLLFAIDYNNVSKAEASIVTIPDGLLSENKRLSEENIINELKKQRKLKIQTIPLEASTEYVTQKKEFSMDGLKYGKYALIVQGVGQKDHVERFLLFDISNLAYTTYVLDNVRTFFVTNRITGSPIANATLTVYEEKYNPASRMSELTKTSEHKTDKNGIIAFNSTVQRSFKVVIESGKDKLDMNNFLYNYERGYYENDNKFAEFYTDRAIYRPGQPMYFKALFLSQHKNTSPKLLKNTKVNIVLRDANYQEVAKVVKVSNEFGSINGSFVLPEGKLNGRFSLNVSSDSGIHGQHSFLVEEYKRPTFEVVLNKPEGEIKLDQKVVIKGKAESLAGVTLNDAKVNYTVKRTARFPFWRLWWIPPAESAEFIVKTGSILTDVQGMFEIEFTAIPDKKIDKKDRPYFNYQIEAEITDMQGETRTAISTVSVGYNAFDLSSNLRPNLDVTDINKLVVNATGSSGQKISTNGTIEVFKLKEPNQVGIKKYWSDKPDFPLPSDLYRKHFPQYESLGTEDFSNWEVEKKVMAQAFVAQESINIKGKLSAGVYKMEFHALDKDGQAITGTEYLIVTDFAKGKFPNTQFLFERTNQASFQPGDRFILDLGTPDSKITVHYVLEKDGKQLSSGNLKVDRTGKILLPITEEYRGNFSYTLFYVKNNRWFKQSGLVSVPWTNKELSVTFESFRDKTKPGSEEQYQIKISGQNKEKVLAEVLASMYDASLDQFAKQYWTHSFYPESYERISPQTAGFGLSSGRYYNYGNTEAIEIPTIIYPHLLPLYPYNYGYSSRDYAMPAPSTRAMMKSAPASGAVTEEAQASDEAPNMSLEETHPENELPVDNHQQQKDEQSEIIQVRKNLKETVFFFPELMTDPEGNLIIRYTMNEALTRWKLRLLAHTTDLKVGYEERMVQTQKDLMVSPNAPRFLRDGDKISFIAKVSNLSESALSGKAKLQFWDAITMKEVTSELLHSSREMPFDLDKGNSAAISWEIEIPATTFSALTYRVTAINDKHSDAEENTIPVVTNSILVTETMPFWLSGNSAKMFTFKSFKNNKSATSKDFRYTVEYTSSPVWYAVQALPYMQSSNNISTQSLVDRMYTNLLASAIANAHPRIKKVLDTWKLKDKDALLSNLAKNEELKSAILEETPWVRQALNETEQKNNIAVLFDLNKMADEKATAIRKLHDRQLSNGGFTWLPGGKDNVYITQLVLENIGHLYRLEALNINDPQFSDMVSHALKYMDEELVSRYQKLKDYIKKYGGNLNDDHLDALSIQYMYVKTFFSHVKPSAASKEARDYYYDQAQKYWTKRSLYSQAMIGLIMLRTGNNTSTDIIKSLRERSFSSDELGMYWNEGNGFNWYQLPIERHAMLIEFFAESGPKSNELDKMKIWLLKNKQTNNWKTSKATSAAIYALLIQGETAGLSKWITESVEPVIIVGTELLNTSTQVSESGTGYIKKSWDGEHINKDMAVIKVTNNNSSVSWGAAYYQYFEESDKIKTFEDTPLKLNKKLYKVVKDIKGERLSEVTESKVLKPGDLLTVRIELRVDREMEFVHMKDMRASGLEPVNVISSYKYQGGLGYYESTKDLATHFYFSHLSKGTFIFEYQVRVVHKGDFSAGITHIECMYAPEFSSHSEGIRIKVEG
ncbi:MAG: hypothetical protein J5I52_00565 [Saprospiraceae bacterium]|nr:MAG: alpha-2-macroglobulin [Bacteroidetes bacterium OLB9]MCO6462616.1 hypothetical protein [Saprospiraceae bacterium]